MVMNPNISGIITCIMFCIDCCCGSAEVERAVILCDIHMVPITSKGSIKYGSGLARSIQRKWPETGSASVTIGHE